MADIQIVMEVVGEKSIVSATKSTMRLENEVKSLSKSLEAGRINEGQFSTGLKELRRSLNGNGKSWQYNKAQIDGYVKSLKAAKVAQDATVAAQQAAKKQAQAVRELNAALAAQRKAQDENTASLSRLRAGYDSNYAAEQRRLELKRRLRQEILNGNMTLREAGAELLKYRQHMQQFNTAQMAATKTNNRFGVVTQQAGYQIGDFLVQVQSGTNWMVAFGQQATQLVGVLPLLAPSGGKFLGMGAGTLIGLSAALGVVIPLVTAFGAYFLRTEKDVEKAKNGIDEFTSALSSYKDQVEISTSSTTDLREEFGKFAEDIKSTADFLKEVSVMRALESLNTEGLFNISNTLSDISELDAALQGILGESENLKNAGAGYGEILKAQREEMDSVANSIGLSSEKALELKSSLDAIQRAESIEGVAQAAQNSIKFFQAIRDETGRIPPELLKVLEELEKVRAAAARAASEGGKITFNTAEESAQRLVEKLGLSVELARKLAGLGFGQEKQVILDPRDPNYDPIAAGMQDIDYGRVSPFDPSRQPKEETERGGGGGGKAQEDYIASLLQETRLKASLVGLSEREAAKKQLLNTLIDKGVDLDDKRIETLLAEQDRLSDLTKAYESQQEMVGMLKDTLTNAFMSIVNGSASVASAFRNMMRQILSSLAQKSLIQPLVSGLTGGLAGGIAGGAGIAGVMGTIGSSLSAGFMTSVYGGLAGTAGAVSGGLAAGGMAGFATAAGAIAAPLLAVAAAISFFKKKVKELDSGLSVSVNNLDTFVESFQTLQTKRFWGLSKKTRTSTTALGSDNPVSQMIGEVQNSIFDTAQYLGIATDSLNNFTYKFSLSLKGLSEEAKLQKISEEVTKLGDSFASLLPKISSVAELQAVYEERLNLEVRLLQALGDTQALRDRELAATSDYNKAILQQVFAAEDAKTAISELNSALNSLSENDFATMLDFRRAQASIRSGLPVANSLGSVGPMPASGASVISSASSGTSGEVAQLRADMKEMHKEVMFAYSKLIKNAKDSRDTLRGWDIVGIPPERTA